MFLWPYTILLMKTTTMKLTFILITFFLFSLSSCKKEKVPPPAEIPIQKEVTYHIFAAKDYSAPTYQNIKADLRLQVRIIDYKTGEMKLVWDSTFSTRKITAFPSYDNKLVIKKVIPIRDSHEKLNGSYSVRYDVDGYIKQEGFSDEAGPGRTSVLIEADM